MSDVRAEPRGVPDAATREKTTPQEDPLAGDWSDGLPGPVRAHGLPLPHRLGEPRLPPPQAEQPVLRIGSATEPPPMAPVTPWSEPVPNAGDDDWSMAPPANDGGAADWGAPAPQPVTDWPAAPPAAAAADDLWAAPAGAPAVTDWTPSAPARAAPRLGPSSAVPDDSAWAAPPPAAGGDLSPEPAAPQLSRARPPEFAPLAPGASLAADEHDAPRAVDDDEAASLLRPVSDGDVIAGEHRVAIHTRGGRTRRGTVTDVDLSAPHLTLLPQGGKAAEIVPHSDVKAIFFMLAPNEAAPAVSGAKIRVTFSDGRMVEGQRDGADLRQGLFLVPADAQKTNTKRIYVAKDAVASIADL